MWSLSLLVKAAMSHHVSLKGVGLKIGSQSILENINLQISPQRILTVIGPNGAGKTSLVRIILGLQKATIGRVEFKPGLRFGYTPQKVRLDPLFPCTMGRFLEQTFPVSLKQKKDVCARVGLRVTLLEHPVAMCSGGELQRLLLAKALLGDPELLVLDEPVQGVDVLGQSALYSLITQIREEYGCAIVLVSHDLHVVMASTDEVLCINHHICCHGSPQQVSRDPAFLDLFGWYQHHHHHRHD
jgi:zinc transport system ATP-binding protein